MILQKFLEKFVMHYATKGMFPVSDKWYLEKLFFRATGCKLDLKNPRTFNEKLQWLKLYDRKPEYTQMVDKYEVKKLVAQKIGEEYIIPTLGVWEKFDRIDFDRLPQQFVLKCTHDSGSVIVVKDKSQFDRKAAKKKLDSALKRNFYYWGREWPYKNVKPRIIAEKYMTDESGTELKDYKIFNFDGKPEFIQVDYNRFVEHRRNLYSTDWKYMEKAIQYATDPSVQIQKPQKLDEMLDLAKKLSAGIPHVRTDFYSIDGGKIYFGELTFYHGSGFEKFDPEEFGVECGNMIKLPHCWGGGVHCI